MKLPLHADLQQAVDQDPDDVQLEHPLTHKVYFISEIPPDVQRRALEALKREEDLAAIRRGIEDMEAGRGVPLEEASEQIRQELGLPPASPQ